MTAVLDRPDPGVSARPDNGGRPARRAVVRWAWRLFKREWRRQALILALLMLAVAATVVGLGIAANATYLRADPLFGTADSLVSIPGTDPGLSGDLAALRARFGTIDVIAHSTLAVPGSITAVDLRAEDPAGAYGRVTLRVDRGRFPAGPAEVAVTGAVAQDFGLRVGGTWPVAGSDRRVVGVVENPLNLTDQFALVGPGQLPHPTSVTVLLDAGPGGMGSPDLPSGTGVGTGSRGAGSAAANDAIILVLGTLGLVFVGLMGVAGFTVMAQRRLRALGLLRSLGATDRHIRLVMIANGGVVGAVAAVAGAVIGVIGWVLVAPTVQSLAEHRVDRFRLPWWAIAAAMLLTFLAAVAAAWWPARTVARLPAVAALTGRPPRPQPAHRFAASGALLLGAGLVLLAFADQRRAGFIIFGTLATVVGLLLLAPLTVRVLPRATARAGIAVRLAVRDLARYQARSGAALGAVTLAIGIAGTIAVSAATVRTSTATGNLPANQLILYLVPAGAGNQIPPLTASQHRDATDRVDRLAATVHAGPALELDQPYNPQGQVQPAEPGPQGPQPAGFQTASLADVRPTGRGEEISTMVTLYVATPALLAHYGIDPASIDPQADVISSRRDLGGLQIFDPGAPGGPARRPAAGAGSARGPSAPGVTRPTVVTTDRLPTNGSDPTTLITTRGLHAAGLVPLPGAWLIQTPRPLTRAQIESARAEAAAAGLYIETRSAPHSLAPLRDGSTAAGILLALGVLGMTVGLIRSETAGDLRTLTATGARRSTRRALTGATAGSLAFLGALLGTAGAYGALLVWHRSDLTPLGRVPTLDLVLILVGLPLVATVGGWLLAGREPPAVARRPLE